MPPKKKTVKNAYYFFMEKYRDDRNRKNPNNPISIKDAASLCSPLWQAMSPEEKKVYEDIAKKEKLRIKGMEVKFTTTGLIVSDVERKEREHQEYVRSMKEEIRNMVVELNLTDLLERKFYFIHVNHFCHCDNGDYIPAEVGVACFSLKCGVDDFYHSMVAPGNLPIGYTYKAQKHSTETHGIPIPPSEIGENDFVKLFMDIYGFVKKGSVGEGKPIVFTLNEFEPCVSIFLEKISNAAGYEAKQFKVYDFVTLFFELRNKAASFSGSEGFPVYCLAETEIETDSFAYTKEICCYWHEGSEAPQYCSLSRARRWGFHIADHCSRDLDVTLIPGRHLPSTDKYWNDTPVETYYMPRHSRKKAANKAVPSGDASSVASSSSFQPLRQPKSMGVAVSQVLSKEDGPPSLDSDAFPPIGRRIGANFNRAS
ncbi:protein maelstrom homolog [Ischnura elegans]|uniref:protein maelstrom homolog n=1 Tax=Ischnura elegans TaxID=197161 RepID=UPI001ED89883|nr:protein maelstrom homolog [Ischnura elegans]